MRTSEAGFHYGCGALKRAMDVLLAMTVVIVGAPLIALVALGVLASMGRPILFVQQRVGRDRVPFLLYKFRTMRKESEGPQITAGDDPNITGLGVLLRRSRLDELPQLVNVLRGDMSFVGPRPEVPRYVARYTPDQARLLRVRPGLTDPATLRYRDEERLLAGVRGEDREAFYVKVVMPQKLTLSLDYLEHEAGFIQDLLMLARTAGMLLGLLR